MNRRYRGGKRPLAEEWQSQSHRGKWRQRRELILGLAVLLSICWFFGVPSVLNNNPRVIPGRLNIVEMRRVQTGSFNPKDFFREFGELPVIVEGEVKHHPAYNMSFDNLKRLCGDGTVETKVFDKDSKKWAGLGDTKYMRLSDYVDNHLLSGSDERGRSKNSPDARPRYLTLGLGLPMVCPRLEPLTPYPKYISLGIYPTNMDAYRREGKRNQIYMPVMFIGKKGTKTEMHIDTLLGPFWMSVYTGSKTFRVVTYWDAKKHWDMDNRKGSGMNLLDHQRWERKRRQGGKNTSDVDLMEIWNPDFEAFPELGKVTVYEGTVNAGDWIYLPSAALHGVKNDGFSWGISENALYPQVVNQQADICADSGLKLGCTYYLSLADSECDREAIQKVADKRSLRKRLRECLSSRSSPILKKLESEWEKGPIRDTHLHKIAGYCPKA